MLSALETCYVLVCMMVTLACEHLDSRGFALFIIRIQLLAQRQE